MISRPPRYFSPQTIRNGLQEKRFSSRAVCVSIEGSDSATRKETDIMKSKFLFVALLGSAAMTVQANPGGYRGGGGVGGFRGGAVAHAAPAAHAPVRAGGVSSFHSMPVRNFGGRMTYPQQRFSSFGMRSYRPNGFRQSPIYRNRATFIHSGPFTAANINHANRFARFANYRNPATASVWNQPNSGNQFRNGNQFR